MPHPIGHQDGRDMQQRLLAADWSGPTVEQVDVEISHLRQVMKRVGGDRVVYILPLNAVL
jgi:hypothetical protein